MHTIFWLLRSDNLNENKILSCQVVPKYIEQRCSSTKTVFNEMPLFLKFMVQFDLD